MHLRTLPALSLVLATLTAASAAMAAPTSAMGLATTIYQYTPPKGAKPQLDALTLHKFLGTQERFPSVAVFGPNGCFVGYYLPNDYGRIGTTCAPGGKNIKQLGANTPRLAAGKPTALLLVMDKRFPCEPCKVEISQPQLDKALGARKSQFAVVRTEVVVQMPKRG